METEVRVTDRDPIEFWFDFGSPYSYLTAMRIEDVAAAHGLRVHWKAILLGPIFQALGWQSTPMLANELKTRYMWRDMERQAHKFHLPWSRPSVFPRTAVLPARIVVLGKDEPWIGEFVRGIMQLNFAEDADIDNEIAVGRLLDRLGLPSASIIRDARSDGIKQALRHRTNSALEKGIFGAPTFFVDQEMFWGNDRLEDALEFAISSSGR